MVADVVPACALPTDPLIEDDDRRGCRSLLDFSAPGYTLPFNGLPSRGSETRFRFHRDPASGGQYVDYPIIRGVDGMSLFNHM